MDRIKFEKFHRGTWQASALHHLAKIAELEGQVKALECLVGGAACDIADFEQQALKLKAKDARIAELEAKLEKKGQQ